jgi:mevalonate kinase
MKNKTLQWFYRDRLIKLQNSENKKKLLSQETECSVAETRISTGQNNKQMLKINVNDESVLFPKSNKSNLNKMLVFGASKPSNITSNTTRIVSDRKSLFKQSLNETFRMGCISDKGVSMLKSHKSKTLFSSMYINQELSSPTKLKDNTPITDRTVNFISNASSSLFKTLNLDDKLNKSMRYQKSSDYIQVFSNNNTSRKSSERSI